MPELPEVETIRRGLEKVLVGKKITGTEVLEKHPIRPMPPSVFVKSLKDRKVESVERIGKLLAMGLSGDVFLLVHLKMTGQLIYRFDHRVLAGGHNLPHFKENDLPTKYTWICWTFSGGSKLYFNDMRKFGYVKVVNKKDKEKIFGKYGVEPLTKEFTSEKFTGILNKRTAPVKSVLMNQALIAGIGNIYADEICFHARILPDRKAKDLSKPEAASLYKNCNHIMKEAIKHGGTTFKDYLDAHGGRGNYIDYLMVYQREKEKCLRCRKGIISVKKIGGRSTRFCPVCQK
jgi:formamidopyrimidine-DNA glycosylase